MIEQPLFVKDGPDFAYQRGMAATEGENGGFQVSIYRHYESSMRIVLCRIPRPLYSLNIYVPTVPSNDKGLPHTLEHLIFCGSQRYPSRGYLDALANCNLSTGTNAWTSDDHTCYTLSTASEEALANVLPVYLDHVLHPLLKDEQFVTEVYHYDATGKEQGVVFSEMVARENGEGDLFGINIGRLMNAQDSPYTFIKPLEFWLDLLKTWMIDAPTYHVAMTPSATLGPQLENARREVEKRNEASIVDKEEHARAIARAVETSKVNIPASVRRTIPMPDLSRVTSLPHSQRLDVLTKAIGPASAVQLIWIESEFPEVILHIPNHVPNDLRPYMVLFQELLLCSDLLLPAGVIYDTEEEPTTQERRIAYTTVVERLAALTTSSESAIGFGNENFSCGWLEELFVLSINSPREKLNLAVRWLIQALMFAEFTAERILTVAQNLLSEINDWKRDGYLVAMTVITYFTAQDRPGKPRWMDKYISIFEQESVLKHIIEQAKAGNIESLVSKLNSIQDLLIASSGGFLTLAMPSNADAQSHVADFTREWDANLVQRSTTPVVTTKVVQSPFPYERSTRFPVLSKPQRLHIPMPSLQASYVQLAF
ncbi:hypothetical protein GGI18_001018, partial [Coemansia linderi]